MLKSNKILINFIIPISLASSVHAEYREEVYSFCNKAEDYKSCIKSFKTIPPIDEPPTVNPNKPVELKTIPYNYRDHKRTNRHHKKNSFRNKR